jgi:hypothetical protein
MFIAPGGASPFLILSIYSPTELLGSFAYTPQSSGTIGLTALLGAKTQIEKQSHAS